MPWSESLAVAVQVIGVPSNCGDARDGESVTVGVAKLSIDSVRTAATVKISRLQFLVIIKLHSNSPERLNCLSEKLTRIIENANQSMLKPVLKAEDETGETTSKVLRQKPSPAGQSGII